MNILYQVFQSNMNNFQICISLTDGTLTGTITPGQNGLESNDNERVFYTPWNRSLTTRYSLVSYSGHPF